jgi:hypothetical protein
MIFSVEKDQAWLREALSRELRAAFQKHAGEGAWMVDATQMSSSVWDAIIADAAKMLLALIAYRLGTRTSDVVQAAIEDVDAKLAERGLVDPIVRELAELDEPEDASLPLTGLIRRARQRVSQ